MWPILFRQPGRLCPRKSSIEVSTVESGILGVVQIDVIKHAGLSTRLSVRLFRLMSPFHPEPYPDLTDMHSQELSRLLVIDILEVDQNTAAAFGAEAMRFILPSHKIIFQTIFGSIQKDYISPFGVYQ